MDAGLQIVFLTASKTNSSGSGFVDVVYDMKTCSRVQPLAVFAGIVAFSFLIISCAHLVNALTRHANSFESTIVIPVFYILSVVIISTLTAHVTMRFSKVSGSWNPTLVACLAMVSIPADYFGLFRFVIRFGSTELFIQLIVSGIFFLGIICAKEILALSKGSPKQ